MPTRAAVRPSPLAGLAATCAAATGALYVLLLRSYDGQQLDQRALDRRALAAKPARYAIHTLLTTISVGMLVVVIAILVGQAIVRRRPPLALVAAAIVGGAPLWTEAHKHLLDRPSLFPGEPFGNTFPSGHTTVAFAVGIAATLVAPPHLRRAVGAGAALYGAAVGIAVVAAGWHRPSDVAGAYLVVTGWAALVALAALIRFPGLFSAAAHDAGERRGEPILAPRHLLLAGIALAGGYVALLAFVLARRGSDIDWTLPGGTFLAAGAMLAVLAALLTAALLAALHAARADAGGHEDRTAAGTLVRSGELR
ncbi:MAG: phosphatase PAP2 family protein [Conexibacter sp.]